jgi:putative radical SAM enzyme (TIGR03279 family)
VVRIAEIETGSIAEALSLEIGTRIVRINGERVRDGIDLTFLLADTALELETVTPGGEAVVYDIERDPGTPVGIVPAPDTIRECANKCVFCFIDGNPEGVRQSLWLRDDDFRLSFTYGSYVTLTNLGPKGLQRLIDQRISPLYVSVHATEPDVRERLLVNQSAGLIMDHLRSLLEGGLEVHTQVVLCPEWNDGVHLERTIDDLWGLGEGIRSLSVVPVGLTRYNLNRPVRLLRADEARAAIEAVDRVRARALDERSLGWCYAADEMYLTADLPLPGSTYYDDGALYENGVGAVRRFVDGFDEGLERVPRLVGRRLRLVTGRSMAPFLRERAARLAGASGAEVEVVEIVNDFFGETCTVAGLLAGRDIAAALGRGREDDVVLLPAEALNADDLFIDSMSRAELEGALAEATVLTGYEITEALAAL